MATENPTELFDKWFESSESWERDLINRLWNHNLSNEEHKICCELYSTEDSELNVARPAINFDNSGMNAVERIVSLSNLQNIGAIKNEIGVNFSKDSGIKRKIGVNPQKMFIHNVYDFTT